MHVKSNWLRTALSVLALAAAVAVIIWVIHEPAIVGVSVSKRSLPIYCVQREEKVAALSFDAGWGNEDTQQLIDILTAHNVRATFFLVGDWVKKYPESVRALADAGQEIMNHSSTHPHLSQLSTEEIQAELNDCSDKIEAITGTRPTLFRCPYGEYDDHVIDAVQSLGVTAIQWDVERRETTENRWPATDCGISGPQTSSKYQTLFPSTLGVPSAEIRSGFCVLLTDNKWEQNWNITKINIPFEADCRIIQPGRRLYYGIRLYSRIYPRAKRRPAGDRPHGVGNRKAVYFYGQAVRQEF